MQADLNLKMLIFTVQAPRYQRGLSQPCPVLDSSVTWNIELGSVGLALFSCNQLAFFGATSCFSVGLCGRNPIEPGVPRWSPSTVV